MNNLIDSGIFMSLSDDEYRAGGGLSSTLLREFIKAPALAWHHLHHRKDKPPSDAFVTGLLCHALVLEPDTVPSRFIVCPESINKRTKAGKAELAALTEELESGGQLVTQEQMNAAIGVRDSVMAHEKAGKYFALGKPELSVFAKDPITGISLCCRCDWLCKYPPAIIDLKTSVSAASESFQISAIKYGYHIQAVHYLETCRYAGLDVDEFTFVAVEKEPPYLCQLFRLSPVLHDHSYNIWREAVNQFAQAQADNDWPGYGQDIIDIELKRWML